MPNAGGGPALGRSLGSGTAKVIAAEARNTVSRVVVFDMDGVLLEGASLHLHTGRPAEREATAHALAELGIRDPDPAFLDANELGSYENLVRSVAEFGVDVDPAAVWPIRERKLSAIELEALSTGERPFYPDTGVIGDLAAETAGVGIASNARHRTVRGVVAHAGWDGAVPAIRGQRFDPDDWYRHKPEPDYVEDVLDGLGTQDGLYVGDSESDVVVARRVGLESVFVRRPHNRDRDLEVRPDHEIEDLAELFALL